MNSCRRIALCLAFAALAGCRAGPFGEKTTFVVMGDNRGGDDSGKQPAAFHDLVREVQALRPALVWNTGDMIYGRTNDLDLVRRQWDRYREALTPLRMPVFHVPGNHDIWDADSARLYRELWGSTRFVHDAGVVRFIALDTEEQPGRLGPEQFEWLRETLERSAGRRVFVVLHRPLFPAASHRETSLDEFPTERDALHQLFVRHRDRIAAVFAGHEHLYHHEVRDGIAYYITGGAGADLHVPPERGGFHHFLLVQASEKDVRVEVRKTGRSPAPAQPARRVQPGELLASWETNRLWFTWDYSVSAGRTLERAREGKASLRMNIDLRRCGWPVLYTPLDPDAGGPRPAAWRIDVFAPEDIPESLSVAMIAEGSRRYEAPPQPLHPGWNRVRTAITPDWLPESRRDDVRSLQWVISADNAAWQGSVLFDGFTTESADGSTVEPGDGWEDPLVWNVWPETLEGRFVGEGVAAGRRAVRLAYPATNDVAPMLIGKAGPPLDLRGIAALEISVFAPHDPPALSLVLRSAEEEFAAPPGRLVPGGNLIRVNLGGPWLPEWARRKVEQVAWRVEPRPGAEDGWLVFDAMRAAAEAAVP